MEKMLGKENFTTNTEIIFQTKCPTSSNTHTVGMSLNCYVLPALSWLSCNKGTIDIGDSSVKQKQ